MLRNLERNRELFESYDKGIQKNLLKEQWKKSVVKAVMVSQNFFYPTGQLIVKMPNVQSCQFYTMHCTRENRKLLSLNDCLKTGTAFVPAKEHPDQKKIKPIVLCGNLQKASPQIQIKKVPVRPKKVRPEEQRMHRKSQHQYLVMPCT